MTFSTSSTPAISRAQFYRASAAWACSAPVGAATQLGQVGPTSPIHPQFPRSRTGVSVPLTVSREGHTIHGLHIQERDEGGDHRGGGHDAASFSRIELPAH